MIQELISTSSPKCLDGNAGFGIVAQTEGMPPNVAKDVAMLSGYSHLFPAGDPKNPVAFLHVVRRSGGQDRHIISRVADCGNDYSGRTNRIGHHLIVEETDVYNAIAAQSCPVVIAQRERFIEVWNQPSDTLPRGKELSSVSVSAGICRHWQQRYNDAGWGGVVAETIEKGDPVSILYEPGTDVLSLLAEVFALLPPTVRWKTTFSTFFMKSQEPPHVPKIQVKCIVVGSDAMAFAKLTPNTLLIDLRQPPSETPTGKYVEAARTGKVAQPAAPLPPPKKTATPEQGPIVSVPMGHVDGDIYGTQDGLPDGLFDGLLDGYSMSVPTALRSKPPRRRTKQKSVVPWIVAISIIGLLVVTASLVVFKVVSDTNRAARLAVEEARKMATEAEKAVAEATQMVDDANAAVGEAERKANEAKDAADTASDHATKAKDASNVADAEAALDEAKKAANKTKTAAGAASKKAEDAINAADKASEKANEAITAAQEANEKTGKAKTQDADEVRSKATAAATAAQKTNEDAEKAKDAAEKAKEQAKGATKTAEGARNEAQTAVASVRQKEQKAAMSADATTPAEEQAPKEDIVKQQLAKLPPFWPGIALKNKKTDEPVALGDSQFLWGVRDNVKITVTPFVCLDKTQAFGIVQETKTHEISFFLDEDREKPKEQKPPLPLLIKFSLTEAGLSYYWKWEDNPGVQKHNDETNLRQLNRVLLSKLRVELDGAIKEIALWTPVTYTVGKFNDAKDKNGCFAFWRPDGKQFVVDWINENVPLLLDFDKFLYDEKPYSIEPKKFRKHHQDLMLSYVPELTLAILDGSYGVNVPSGKNDDLKIELGYVSKTVGEESEKAKNKQKDINDLLKKSNYSSLPAVERRVADIQKENNELKNMPFKQDEMDRHSNNQAEMKKERDQRIKDNEAEYTNLKNLLEQCANLGNERTEIEKKIKIEKAKGKKLRVEQFSIDLVRAGTPEDKAALQENRLLLFQVTDGTKNTNTTGEDER